MIAPGSVPMEPQYLTGADAIDLARLTGLQLHRAPARANAVADTDWSTAELLVSSGTNADDFFLDLTRLSSQEASDCIQSLVGLWKAYHTLKAE